MKKQKWTTLALLCCLYACSKKEVQQASPLEKATTKATAITAASDQTGGSITVNIWDKKQWVDALGAGSYFYSGHVMNGITNPTDAHAWLWQDLNVNTYRIVLWAGNVENVNDNNDPNTLNMAGFDFTTNTNLVTQIAGVKKAQLYKPGIKIWAVVLSPPQYLKTNNNVTNGGTLNTAYPNAYAEYGEFVLAHLINLKNNGITVDYLSMMNEPDVTLDHEDADFTTTEAQAVYSNSVNWLKGKLPSQAIPIPVFTGAEPLNVTNAASYTNAIKTTGNLGRFTCHQYGGSSEPNFNTASAAAGTQGLYMTEWHAGHGMGSTPDEMTAAFDLVNKFNDAFRGGARGWLYFEWGNPNLNFAGLLQTPWGAPAVRRKNYYTFQQYTKDILNRQYITTTLSGITNFGTSNVSAFSSSNTAIIHVMNWSTYAQNRVRMNFGGNITSIRIFRTTASESNKLIWSQDNVNLNYYDVDFAGKSFITVQIWW